MSGFLVHVLGSLPLPRRQRGDHGDMLAGQAMRQTHCLPFLFCPLDWSPWQLHRSTPEALIPHPRAAVQGRVTPSESYPQGRVTPGQSRLRSGSPPDQGHRRSGSPQARVTQVMAAPRKTTFLQQGVHCPGLPYPTLSPLKSF